MRYSEKENFSRTVTWNNPSHVPWEACSIRLFYTGAWPRDSRPAPGTKKWLDLWGVGWTDIDGEIFPTEPAIRTLAELDKLKVPKVTPALFKNAEEILRNTDRSKFFISVGHPYFLYEKAFNILGGEEFLYSLAAEPEATHRLLDMILGFELEVAAAYVKLFNPEQAGTSDDYGMQDRLAVSQEMWREFFKPRLAKLHGFYRKNLGPEAFLSHHSCGHVMPILEDFIELGINAINPIQTTANDLPAMRKSTSRRLVLARGICGQRVLPFGTPEEVRQEVFKKLDMLWEGGGYLPGPEKSIGIPEENVTAMNAAVEEWSKKNVGD